MEADLIYSQKLGPYIFETYNNFPSFPHAHVKQVHSGDVIIFDSKNFDENTQVDGIIVEGELKTAPWPAIKTADCLPIGILGEKGVAMLHAGWRGLEKKIIQNPQVQAIKPIEIVIGPHISPKNYEVGEEFLNIFSTSDSLQKIDNKLTFSQEKEVIFQIRDCYGQIPIHVSNQCTFDTPQLHSYRREKGSGRNVSVLKKQ